MSWFIGFGLGVLGGFALGSLVGPLSAASRASAALRRRTGGASTGAGGRVDGMLLDERLSRAVHERLEARGLTNPRVDVTTVDGVVYLRGRTTDDEEKLAVVEVTQGTPGITRVVDELKAGAS